MAPAITSLIRLLSLGFVPMLLSGCLTNTFYSRTVQPANFLDGDSSRLAQIEDWDKGFVELPEGLATNESIRVLNLTGCYNLNLNRALAEVTGMPNLQVLVLDSCGVRLLPNQAGQLRNIKHLGLAGNPDLQLHLCMDVLVDMQLEHLDLSDCNLKELPAELPRLRTLRSLKLSGNWLGSAADFELLAQLPNLEWLCLDGNRIETLDPAIGKLDQVRYLMLENNELSDLPAEMEDMQSLWTLFLTGNAFNSVPTEVLSMPEFRFLAMGDNDVSHVPMAFSQARKTGMQAIVLDDNQLPKSEAKNARRWFRSFELCSFKRQGR